jgi:hypothetical protein
MWVRVARFEGGTAEAIEAETANTKQQLSQARTSGPPPGLEGVKRVVEAINRERGAGVSLVFCDSEDDIQKVHQALDAMSPSSQDSGRRSSVELYEVVTDEDMA